jgi:hypothetical protein
MEQRQRLSLLLELIWWIVTAVVVLAVLYPIHRAMYVWPYQTWNIVFIVVFITFSRYIFQLRHTFLARRQILKIAIILACFPLAFTLISGFNSFLSYIGDRTWEPLTGHLPLAQREPIQDYIWGEMVFFGVGSIIVIPILAVRLFVSIWTLHNRGVV